MHVLEHFQHIYLAGELERVAVTTVGMQHERISGRVLASVLLLIGQKVIFAERFAATVEPKIQASRSRVALAESCRNDNAVGLVGSIDFGFVAADDQLLFAGVAKSNDVGPGATFESDIGA